MFMFSMIEKILSLFLLLSWYWDRTVTFRDQNEREFDFKQRLISKNKTILMILVMISLEKWIYNHNKKVLMISSILAVHGSTVNMNVRREFISCLKYNNDDTYFFLATVYFFIISILVRLHVQTLLPSEMITNRTNRLKSNNNSIINRHSIENTTLWLTYQDICPRYFANGGSE